MPLVYRLPEWIRAENNMLRVMAQFYSILNIVVQAVHKCGSINIENPHKCAGDLDDALKQAQELEKLSGELIKALKEMREMVGS